MIDSITFNIFSYIICIISVYLVDLTSQYLFYKYKRPYIRSLTASTRWFFIHIITNLLVMYLTFSGSIECLKNITICDKTHLYNNQNTIVFKIAKISHLYHLFLFKISHDELLHHLIMCVISAPIVYTYNYTLIIYPALFILTGLPGFINYTNLFLVKLGYMKSSRQKIIYFYIDLFFRAPMCSYIGSSQIIYNNASNDIEYIFRLFLGLCIVWNGQYFLYLTIKDCLNKRIL